MPLPPLNASSPLECLFIPEGGPVASSNRFCLQYRRNFQSKVAEVFKYPPYISIMNAFIMSNFNKQ